MDLALGAATAAISRAGASSLAELAAMRLPSLLIPFPAATDNHQFYNARAFETTNAACMLEQRAATPKLLAAALVDLMEDPSRRQLLQSALGRWHQPQAAQQIAQAMLQTLKQGFHTSVAVPGDRPGGSTGNASPNSAPSRATVPPIETENPTPRTRRTPNVCRSGNRLERS